MPNWCYNNISITGPRDKLKEFTHWMNNDQFETSAFVPYPDPYEALDRFDQTRWRQMRKHTTKIPDYEIPDGYNIGGYSWAGSSDGWGVKWTPSEASVAIEVDNIGITCDTPWAPPTALMVKISSLFPDLHFFMHTEEESEAFCIDSTFENGEYTEESVDGCYEHNDEDEDDFD